VAFLYAQRSVDYRLRKHFRYFEDYRRSILTGLSYWVQSGAATGLSQPRIQAPFEALAQRLDATIGELRLEEFVT
jgi:hypothetical protein